MGKKLRNFLTAFITALAFVVLAFSVKTETVKAANYTNSDMVTSGYLTNENKDYTMNSNVPLQIYYDTTGYDLKDGDTLTIDIPSPLKVDPNSPQFEIKDDDGVVIGIATMSQNNQIVITFNENIESQENVKGNFNIDTGVSIDKDNAQIGQNDVKFPIKDGHYQDSILNIKTSQSNMSKKGVIGTDDNGDAIVTWTIIANRNGLNFGDLTISDAMTDPNLEYIKGSVVVQEAYWKDYASGTYRRGDIVPEDEYTLTEKDNGFDLNIKNSGTQMYAITFQTKITDPNNATNGTVFKNYATMNGSTAGNGNGSSVIEDSASGKVTSGTNSGNGSGNKLGSVILTKVNEQEESSLLAGATYDLYKVGSDTPIKTGLTTDENGQINVTGLSAGDYYFLETKAPDGYQLNQNEVPFTITGQTTSAVNVTAEDEPESETLGSIVIRKIDDETGYKLAGAEFNVVNEQGEIVGTITTDRLGIGHLYNLPVGKYTLVETKAPAGYLIGQNIDFEITADHLTPALISVENEKEIELDGSYTVLLQKFDRDNMTVGVPGAEYGLYKSDGTLVTHAVTNELGVIKIDGLEPGSYYFQETKAPDGYDINNDKISFVITENNNETGVGTLVTSDPKTNSGNEGNGGTEEPGTDTDGNGEDNNGNEEDNNGGIIVDPENPGSNNNNNGDVGIITNPINPGNSNNGSTGSSNSNGTLPQTGAKSGLIASLLGLILLSGVVYYKRRNA